MPQKTNELQKYATSWEKLNPEERRAEIPEIVKFLCRENNLSSPKVEILTVGPPGVQGFYDISKDVMYFNAYMLDCLNFKSVLRSLAHLVRYKSQVNDVVKYLKVLKSDNSAKTNPKYDNVRKLKENIENYYYPWGKKGIVPKVSQSKEIFWISVDGEVDWDNFVDKS